MAVPEFDQVVEYVTMGPVVHFVLPHQLSLDTLLVLEALREGYEHAAQLGRVLTMAPEEVAALKGAASEVYHQDVVDHEVVSANPAEIVERLIEVRSYPEAHRGAVIREAGEVWFFESNLYKSITPHTIHDPRLATGPNRLRDAVEAILRGGRAALGAAHRRPRCVCKGRPGDVRGQHLGEHDRRQRVVAHRVPAGVATDRPGVICAEKVETHKLSERERPGVCRGAVSRPNVSDAPSAA